MEGLVPSVNTSTWYRPPPQCIRWNQERVGQRHTFVGPIPEGAPLDPAPAAKITFPDAFGPHAVPAGVHLPYGASHWSAAVQWATPWPTTVVDPTEAMEAAVDTPQFAWRLRGSGAAPASKMDVESQLRRLDRPLGKCYQGVIPEDAPLYRNTVAPPIAVNVPPGVQNACNPIAVIRGPQGEGCREEADRIASSLSGRWVNNPTRQDTQRLDSPVSPPGMGTVGKRPGGVSLGGQLMPTGGGVRG
jgi:hypothetical protein